MQEINTYIGRRIREAREDMGWKQTDLAKALSYSVMAVSHFEKGRRAIKSSQLWNLAQVLNKPVRFFLPNSTLSQPL